MPARPPLFDDVALALLREGQAVRFRAAGLSMEPSIRDGDEITVAPVVIDDVRVGDVLLYRGGDRLLAHRVIGHADGPDASFRVRGDAPGWEEERVSSGEVLGRIDLVERNGRSIRSSGVLFRRLATWYRRVRRRLSGTRTTTARVRTRAQPSDSHEG